MNPETRIAVVGANRAPIAQALRERDHVVVESDHVRENDPETVPNLNAVVKSFGSGYGNRHERRKAEKMWRCGR